MTTTPYSAEQVAESMKRIEFLVNEANLPEYRASLRIINASLSQQADHIVDANKMMQQAAPGVAGEQYKVNIDNALANNNKITRKAMAERDKAIHAMRKKFSVIEIAEMVGLTRQRVHQILNEPLDEDHSIPFAWATFDGEGSYDLRLYEENENYRDEWLKRNGQKYAGWVIPLFPYASQPHPTGDTQPAMKPTYYVAHPDGTFSVADPQPGDTQQEAVAWMVKREWPEGRAYYAKFDRAQHEAECFGQQPIPLFTHPPEATALAEEVKEKAVEICDATLVDMNAQAASEYYFTYKDGIDECKARIAAIPIEPERKEVQE